MITETKLVREFKFERDGEDIVLTDPNPMLSEHEVMNHFAGVYPELTTSTVKGPSIKGDKAVYEFTTTIGTKG